MTDRYHSLTVVLKNDIREDDAESIINAVRMIKGVLGVTGEMVTSEAYMAETRALDKVRSQIMDVLYPKGNR